MKFQAGHTKPSSNAFLIIRDACGKTSFSFAMHSNVINLLYLHGLSVFTILTYQNFYDVDNVALPIVYAPHYLLLNHHDSLKSFLSFVWDNLLKTSINGLGSTLNCCDVSNEHSFNTYLPSLTHTLESTTNTYKTPKNFYKID